MSDRLYLEVNGTDVDEDWGDPVVQDQPAEDWGDPVAENPAAPVVAAAIKSNPDQAARARAISQQTQVPADIVERNLPEMEQRVRAEQVSQIAQQDPAIEKALTDPETAKIAHDDVENLSLAAQIGRAFLSVPRAIGAAVPRVNAGLWGVARAAADIVGADDAVEFAKARQEEQKGFAEIVSPKTGNWALDAANSGLTSFAQSMLMAPFGSVGILTSFGLVSGGDAYGEARDAGKGVAESLAFGGAQAGVEMITERLPVKHLMDAIGGRQALLPALKRFAVSEGIGEQIATLWQDFNEWVVLNPEKTVQDFLVERPGRAAETLISTVVSVGASSVVANSVDAVRERGQRAQQAQQATKAVADLVAASESSKLRARDPQAFERFMADAMTDETGDRPDLYIDGQVFAQSLQSAGLPLERLAEVAPTLAQQVAEAVEVGGDVVLPADQFAATLAGTPLAPALLPHLRTSPDAMSVAEAEVFAQNEPVLFQQATEQAIAQTMAEAADRADQDTVYTEILGRLNRAGRFTEDVNQTYAAVPAAIIKTMAQRMGMSAQAFAERWTPTILAENPARPGEALVDFDTPIRIEGKDPKRVAYSRREDGRLTRRIRYDDGETRVETLVTNKAEDELWVSDEQYGKGEYYPVQLDEATARARVDDDLADLGYEGPGGVLNDRGFDYPVVNIGLATNDGGAITADEAIAALRSIGVEVVETAQHESDTEQTLVARLSRPLTPEEGEALSVALRQDAVAQAFGTTGDLFGPKKDDWGPFNPQFFLTLDGRRASESELLNQATALRSGRETLARFGLKPGIKHKTRQVAAALEARQRRKWGVIEPDDRTGKSAQRIANWMAEEVEFEMRNPEDSGVGWYSTKFQRALDKMAAEFPELATDKNARNTMTLLIAITSDGQKVVPNFAQAMDIYANYRATGQFATTRGHIRQASIDANMARLQELYARYDTVEEVHEYLMQEAEVRELQKIAKERGTSLKTDYQVHIKLPMAALELGPKLGAFYANLMGAHGYLTMDRWWSRTFNRYRGTLLQAPTRAGLDRFKELLGRPDMSDDEAIAATVAPRNSYEAKGFKDGTEIEKAANTIYKAAFENLEDSPFNATDRTFMLDAVGRAAKILARRGYNLSIADIQAILWYYEKRLYGDLGARQTADISYEEAADRVVAARAQGLDLRGSDEGTGDPGVLPGEVPVGEEDFVEDDVGGDGVPEPQFNQDFVDRPGSLTRRTPEFKRWFAGSKVVDENGEPLVVYHGSLRDFDAFDMNAARDGAHFFTPLSQHAAFFGDVREFYVSIKNPLVISQDDLNAAWDAEHPDGEQDDRSLLPRDFVKDFVARAKAGGHDGLIIEGFGDLDYTTDVYLPFEANQIKSVDNVAPTSSNNVYAQSGPPSKGIHFSNGVRTVLDGRYYGRGMKGDEAARLANATDPRIRDRVYVYIDRGQGILPEQGVGGFAHEVDLPPLYDASRDPLGLKRGVDANTFESRVLDAGYAGYWVEGFTATQDAAVIMGPASHGLAARAVPPPARPGGVAIAAPQRYSTALTSKEIEIVRDNFDALRDEVPSIKERFGTLSMEAQDLPAAIAALSKLGVQLPGEPLQQAVWHGSPHSVVRFSFDFIGTGEGAQAFGWGLYFAENRDTAKFYHSILAGLPPVRRIKLGWLTFGEFDGFDYSRRAGRSDADNILASIAESLLVNTQELYENRDRFRERIKDELDAQREFNKEDPARLRAVDDLERVLMAPGALDLQFAEAEGAVYKLEIPDEAIERMLVWDKPLSGQSAFAKKALVSTVRDLKTWNHNGITYPNPEALTMEGFYGALERQFGSDKAASEYLNSLGIPGMRYLDGMSRAKGEGHYNIVVWDQALLDKMNEQVEAQLPQQTSDAPRGTFNPSTNTIALLERADLSTFLHETGHWALEMLVDLAAQPGAPTQVVDDARTLLSWAGVESLQAWQGMTLEQRRAAHEKVAEGFETYLFEGNAPSAELQGAFARFRAWMLNVYKSLTRMRVQLTPEVRSVFDRMLATDEQIAEMSRVREMAPMFESAEAAGMTPEDFAAYLKLGEKAANDATADLTARTLRDMKWLSNAKGRALKKLQDSAKELRKGIRAEVETEVDAQPVYAAIAFIEKGVMAERDLTNAQRKALESIAGGKTKLDLAVLKDLYGEDPAAPWRYLKQTLVAAEGGAHPDAVAEAFGFDSGDALVRAILAAEPRQQLVEGLTDQRMLERHGDLTDSESMERAAEMAIHNEARTRFVATEMRTLAEALNPREKVGETKVTTGKFKGQTRSLTVNALMRAAKSYADQIVARTVVRKLSPARHASTAAKEARAAREALAAGKIELALQHKRNQLLHERTSRAMADAQLEFEKMQAYLRKFRNNRARGAIDAGYVEQIENVLAAVDTRNATNKRLDSLQSLREWKAAQEEQGLPVVLDPDLVATMNVTNLRDMTMEQLRGLVDQVKSIEHLGKLKKKLLTARDQREFEAIRDEVAATIRANGGKPRDVPFNPSAHDQAWWKSWRGFFAEHRKFASLVRQFDGVVDNGPIWRILVRGMNDAGNREQALLMDATKKLGAIFAPLEKMKGGLTGDKRLIKSLGKSLSRGDRIAVALNWGNELNRARVLNTLTQPQVDEIFSMLTREEWTAVQAIWDHLNEYWPDIAAKEKRVTGTTPEKVESAPFTVTLQDGSTVDLAGGYYPIAYESELSDVAAAHQQAQIAKDMMAGAYTRATTRRGHTKKRAQNVSEPLTWSLTVIDRHVNQVVHDLAWHEWLIDANRVLRDREVAGAIRAHYGNETLRTMKQALQDIAVGDLQTAGAVGRLVAGLRARASAATMGWSITTALLQPFGILQSIPRVGSKWILKGMRHWAGDLARFENSAAKIREKSSMMRHRTTTFNRDIREVMGRVHRGDSKAKQVFDASLFFAMQKLQLMADVPTWWGAYEKALADGVDEDTAVALADQAVIDAQGSGMTKDLAGVQRGGELQKALSMFYSYFSATWNMMAESTARTDFRNPVQVAGWMADMAMLVVVPALGPAVLLAALQGGDDDEDKETGEILADAGLEVLGFLMGTLIGVREFSGFAKGYSYSGPAFTRAIKDVGDAASKSLPKVVDEDEELEETDYRRIVKAFLVALGLPATQVDRSWRGWRAWQEGEAGPAAILVGPPPKD